MGNDFGKVVKGLRPRQAHFVGDNAEVLKCGVLKKKGLVNKAFKERFLVLTQTHLFYFRTEEEFLSHRPARGCITLAGSLCRLLHTGGRDLPLIALKEAACGAHDERVFWLGAENLTVLHGWIDAIQSIAQPRERASTTHQLYVYARASLAERTASVAAAQDELHSLTDRIASDAGAVTPAVDLEEPPVKMAEAAEVVEPENKDTVDIVHAAETPLLFSLSDTLANIFRHLPLHSLIESGRASAACREAVLLVCHMRALRFGGVHSSAYQEGFSWQTIYINVGLTQCSRCGLMFHMDNERQDVCHFHPGPLLHSTRWGCCGAKLIDEAQSGEVDEDLEAVAGGLHTLMETHVVRKDVPHVVRGCCLGQHAEIHRPDSVVVSDQLGLTM